MAKENFNEGFVANWSKHGFTGAPAGHVQRLLLPDRWVRFHSFADKRHPEDSHDEAQIFEKFVALGDSCFGRNTWIYCVNCSIWDDSLIDDEDPERAAEGYSWRAIGATWNPIEWRMMLMLIAHDIGDFLGLFDPESGNFLAPYDGGFDLILRTSNERDRHAKLFSPWLSNYPGGL